MFKSSFIFIITISLQFSASQEEYLQDDNLKQIMLQIHAGDKGYNKILICVLYAGCL